MKKTQDHQGNYLKFPKDLKLPVGCFGFVLFFSKHVLGPTSTAGEGEMGEMAGGGFFPPKKKKEGGNKMPLRGSRVRANPRSSLMAHAAAGLTPCPVVWLTRSGGSTTTDAPKNNLKDAFPPMEVAVNPRGPPAPPGTPVRPARRAKAQPPRS